MKTDPAVAVRQALEALGAYQKKGQVSRELRNIANVLMDESDRGVVVILGSLLDDQLLERLMGSFVTLTPAQQKNLIRGGGLLNTFDDRINLAQALGIIDEDIVEALQIVKAMRNACAHSRLNINFATPELRGVLALLFDDESAKTIAASETTIFLRLCFISQYLIISELVSGSSREVARAMGQALFDRVMSEATKATEKLQASREKRTKRLAQRPPRNPNGK